MTDQAATSGMTDKEFESLPADDRRRILESWAFADGRAVRRVRGATLGNVYAIGGITGNNPGAGPVILPTYEYIQDVQNQVAAASYATNHTIFVAPNTNETWQVVSVAVRFSTVSTSGTLQVEVAPQNTAIGSGTNQLTGTLSLSTTVNNSSYGTLLAAPTIFGAGSAINLIFAGTVTGLLGTVVTVVLQRIS